MEHGSYLLQLGISLVQLGSAGMGVLHRRAGAMSTGIIIMFAAVGVC